MRSNTLVTAEWIYSATQKQVYPNTVIKRTYSFIFVVADIIEHTFWHNFSSHNFVHNIDLEIMIKHVFNVHKGSEQNETMSWQ